MRLVVPSVQMFSEALVSICKQTRSLCEEIKQHTST
jgi:hypothetical protein